MVVLVSQVVIIEECWLYVNMQSQHIPHIFQKCVRLPCFPNKLVTSDGFNIFESF